MSSTSLSSGYHLQLGRYASVHREEPLVDDAGQREQVEALHEHLINLLVVFIEALGLEVEVAGHLPALVVAPDERHGVGERDLQRVQQKQDFYRERSAVDEISEKQVPGHRSLLGGLRVASDLQDLLEVVVLAVDVPDYCDGVVQVDEVALAFCFTVRYSRSCWSLR